MKYKNSVNLASSELVEQLSGDLGDGAARWATSWVRKTRLPEPTREMVDKMCSTVEGSQKAPKGVGDAGRPWRHLLGLATRQIAEVLAADGEQRAEHEDLVEP